MASTALRFFAATFVTSIDVFVVWLCGPFVWKTWSPFIWSRIGLLFLAGGMAFTLMDIWSQILTKGTSFPVGLFGNRPMLPSPTPLGHVERADV